MISYILPLQCHYRYLYFTWILSSEQQRRSTGSKAGMNCSQLRGKDVKPERESWWGIFSVASERPHVSVSQGLLFCFSFPFWRCLSSVSVQGKRWLRSGAQLRMTRASEFPGELIDLLVSAGCMFLEWSQRLAIGRSVSTLRSVRVMGLMLYSTLTAFPKH